VMAFPTRVAVAGDSACRVRPYYTVRNRLSIRSNPGGGTEVKAMIPLPRESSRKQG